MTYARSPRRVMWNGTVRNLSLAGQLKAARIANCAALSLTPADYNRWLGSAISTRDMLSMAADAGVQITHLDPFVRWVDEWEPVIPSGEHFPVETVAFDRDDFFRMASALEVESFTAFAGFSAGTYTEQQIVDAFGALCSSAEREGLRCDLEIIMVWAISDLAAAWRVIEGAAAPNSGIMLDLWSYFRGNRDDALLATIPGDRITGVQLCDGPAQLPPGMSLAEEALFARRAPGEGDWPVAEVIEVLRGTGGLTNVGPEIFSSVFDRLSAEDIGARSGSILDAVLSAPTAHHV